MFYIGLQGGLGNQMFQYAFGAAASLETGIPLALDLSKYGMQNAKDTPRSFTLQHFNIQAPIASVEATAKFHSKLPVFLRKVKVKLSANKNYEFNPAELRVKNGQYLEGFWQTAKYFEKHTKTIRTELTLKEPLGPEALQAVNEIKAKRDQGFETIMIHVRRGDYVTNAHSVQLMGVLEAEYFIEALEKLDTLLDGRGDQQGGRKPRHIFFASEDVEWIKQNIKPHHDYSFITRPGIYDFEELMVMSYCDHFIISNSSFSWWSAWLSSNPYKIVIAPERWVVDLKINAKDATPAEWIRI